MGVIKRMTFGLSGGFGRLVIPSAMAVISTAPFCGAATIVLRQGVSPTAAYENGNAGIRTDNVNANYGGSLNVTTGKLTTDTGALLRSVFSYSLADIPAGATITGVSLFIQGERNDANSVNRPVDFTLHTLSTTFVEGAGTASGSTGIPGVTWANAPAFSSTVLSTIAVSPQSQAGVNYSFASSLNFIAAAQAALNSGTDLSLLLKLSDAEEAATGAGAGRRILFYHSDEAATLASRPALTITYEVIPEPGTAMLGAMAGLGLLVRRKR